MSNIAPHSSSSHDVAPVQVEFRCVPLRMEQLPRWLASKARPRDDVSRPELSVVHYKGFGQTMDIRGRPPPEDMLRILTHAHVVEFDGDYFEVASDSDAICVNFVCALPMIFACAHLRTEPAPALLAFKLEHEEASFLRSWQGLRCVTGCDHLPYKVAADAPNWAPIRVVEIAYVLVPRHVCAPSYRGGILWDAAAASKLPLQRSHIFSSILDDAKKIQRWEDDGELKQARMRSNIAPSSVLSHEADGLPMEEGCSAHIGLSSQAFVCEEASHHQLSSLIAHDETSHEDDDQPVSPAYYFSGAQAYKLYPGASDFVSLGSLATIATAFISESGSICSATPATSPAVRSASAILVKRQVVAWGGHHIVACEFAVESALHTPNFCSRLPWHYFHAHRTKVVGGAAERQEGLLNGVQFCGLHCH